MTLYLQKNLNKKMKTNFTFEKLESLRFEIIPLHKNINFYINNFLGNMNQKVIFSVSIIKLKSKILKTFCPQLSKSEMTISTTKQIFSFKYSIEKKELLRNLLNRVKPNDSQYIFKNICICKSKNKIFHGAGSIIIHLSSVLN